MNGIIAICIIITIVFISSLAVDLKISKKKTKKDEDKISKHK